MVDDATGVPEGTRVVSLSCGARIGGSALLRQRPTQAGCSYDWTDWLGYETSRTMQLEVSLARVVSSHHEDP